MLKKFMFLIVLFVSTNVFAETGRTLADVAVCSTYQQAEEFYNGMRDQDIDHLTILINDHRCALLAKGTKLYVYNEVLAFPKVRVLTEPSWVGFVVIQEKICGYDGPCQ